ncbi:MAG: DUF4870 domain-containing protein [Nocardioides sp.]|jgi:uncharacterized Tic20 family protein
MTQQPDYGQPPTYATPPQAMTPGDEKTWSVVAHGAALAAMFFSAGFLGFLGSLVVYLLYRDRGPFVRAHSANSLNIQITMFLWLIGLTIAAVVIGILTLGIALIVLIPLLMAAPLFAAVLHIIGLMKANNGDWWDPPMTIRFVS